jgi:hypothetical protein
VAATFKTMSEVKEIPDFDSMINKIIQDPKSALMQTLKTPVILDENKNAKEKNR